MNETNDNKRRRPRQHLQKQLVMVFGADDQVATEASDVVLLIGRLTEVVGLPWILP